MLVLSIALSLSLQIIDIYDHSFNSIEDWRIVNDGVMGGISRSSIQANNKGLALFQGHVSLDNNGGFASIRNDFEKKSIKDKTKVVIRCKGDGKRYQFRLKKSRREYYSYINYFQTNGNWQII